MTDINDYIADDPGLAARLERADKLWETLSSKDLLTAAMSAITLDERGDIAGG